MDVRLIASSVPSVRRSVPRMQSGWFPDPDGSGHLRWFDGHRWVDAYAPQRRPIHWGWVLVLSLLAVVALSALANWLL